MIKKDLIYRVSEEHNLPLVTAQAYVDTVLETLYGCILDCDEISLYGFGRFEKYVRKGRNRTLPNGEHIYNHPKLFVKFIPSRVMEQAIADGSTSQDHKEHIEGVRDERRKAYFAMINKREEQEEG